MGVTKDLRSYTGTHMWERTGTATQVRTWGKGVCGVLVGEVWVVGVCVGGGPVHVGVGCVGGGGTIRDISAHKQTQQNKG